MSKEREEGGTHPPAHNQADTDPYRTQDERPDYRAGKPEAIRSVEPEPGSNPDESNTED